MPHDPRDPHDNAMTFDALERMLVWAKKAGMPRLMGLLINRQDGVMCPVRLGGTPVFSVGFGHTLSNGQPVPATIVHLVEEEAGAVLAVAMMESPGAPAKVYRLPINELCHTLQHDFYDEGHRHLAGDDATCLVVCPDLPALR